MTPLSESERQELRKVAGCGEHGRNDTAAWGAVEYGCDVCLARFVAAVDARPYREDFASGTRRSAAPEICPVCNGGDGSACTCPSWERRCICTDAIQPTCVVHGDETATQREARMRRSAAPDKSVLERLDIECRTVVCECGRPFANTDLHDLIREALAATDLDQQQLCAIRHTYNRDGVCMGCGAERSAAPPTPEPLTAGQLRDLHDQQEAAGAAAPPDEAKALLAAGVAAYNAERHPTDYRWQDLSLGTQDRWVAMARSVVRAYTKSLGAALVAAPPTPEPSGVYIPPPETGGSRRYMAPPDEAKEVTDVTGRRWKVGDDGGVWCATGEVDWFLFVSADRVPALRAALSAPPQTEYQRLGSRPEVERFRAEPSDRAWELAVVAAIPQLPGEVRANIETAIEAALIAAYAVDFGSAPPRTEPSVKAVQAARDAYGEPAVTEWGVRAILRAAYAVDWVTQPSEIERIARLAIREWCVGFEPNEDALRALVYRVRASLTPRTEPK